MEEPGDPNIGPDSSLRFSLRRRSNSPDTITVTETSLFSCAGRDHSEIETACAQETANSAEVFFIINW
jgi:hypothetical protein